MPHSVLSQLTRLFHTHRILTLKQLQQSVGRSRRTLFRDLSQLESVSSYTHAGQYYTVESVAQFNTDGLWFFQGVGFSQHRTLKVTLLHKIHESAAGYTHKELSRLLRIRVHDTLRGLVQSQEIQRRTLANSVYIYLSADDQQANKQLSQRMSWQAVGLARLPSTDSRIEILAETIRYYHRVEVVAEKLIPGLRHRGVPVTREEIEAVLVFYDLKKNKLGRCSIDSKLD
ncbi:MAG: hypothetical protein GY774_37765 [Planctomycetes bacterium]|nr:hypothetical protein [Planctomycetota bacterium]